MTFQQKLDRIVKKNNSLMCVGLDSDVERIPKQVRDNRASRGQFLFNKTIIEATRDLVCSYKLNTAFYESTGLKGLLQLKFTCKYLKDKYPEIPIIIDAKRGDIGNTNRGYVQFIFDFLNGDAVTVSPYLGEEAMGPFLEMKDKGIIILCRTSNSGAGEFQDIVILNSFQDLKKKEMPKQVRHDNKRDVMVRQAHHNMNVTQSLTKGDGIPLYQYVAYQVSQKWNKNKNCLLVVGATYPDELKEVRKIVGQDMWLLVPGIGAQGGDLEATLKAGLNKKKTGLIVNSGRGIIFSKEPREEARKLKEEINKYRV